MPTATPSRRRDDGETSVATLALIAGALIVGFGAMGWFIMRDARRSLPEDERAGPKLREEGPHKHAKQASRRPARDPRQEEARKRTHARFR